MQTRELRRAIAALAFLCACGPATQTPTGTGSDAVSPVPDEDAGGEETAAPGVPDPTAGLDGTTTGAETEGGEGGPVGPPGFIIDPDGGSVSYECSLWDQDCPAGEKCNVYSSYGGAFDGTKCVPIAADPDAPGETCTIEGDIYSGVDSCALGTLCWDVDPETGEGTCAAYCMGSENNPVCADPEMTCTNGRDFALCLPSCCPIEQDCDDGDACVPVSDDFLCVPDGSGDTGTFGDACEYINACDPGLTCVSAELIPGCDGAGCCTPFCTVGSTSCALLGASLACVPWWEEGQSPPGFEDVGACLVPD